MWYQTVPSFLHTYINVLVHFSLPKKLNGWTFKGPESCYPFIQYGCSISSNGGICRARRPPLHNTRRKSKWPTKYWIISCLQVNGTTKLEKTCYKTFLDLLFCFSLLPGSPPPPPNKHLYAFDLCKNAFLHLSQGKNCLYTLHKGHKYCNEIKRILSRIL